MAFETISGVVARRRPVLFGAIDESARVAGAWTLVWAVTVLALVLVSAHLSGGAVVYTLDDPYIHLSVADHILRGGYGVNAAEFSSPSSSILYPLLLAPTIALGLGTTGPLLIGTAAAGASVWLVIETFWTRAVLPAGHRDPWAYLFCPILILSINAYGLPMTGMEHALHVLAVVVAMRGLVAASEGQALPLPAGLAIVLLPFLRFEGLALAGAGVMVLSALGRWRGAGAIALAILAGLSADAAAMHHLGLPLLPSSVLVKSSVAAGVEGGGGFVDVLVAFRANVVVALLTQPWGMVFGAVALSLLIGLRPLVAADPAWATRTRAVVFLMVAGLTAHLLAGRYGWFHRYEVYAVTIMVMGVVVLIGPWIVSRRRRSVRAGILLAASLMVAPYAMAAIETPAAARNVYEQQFQMHRFATAFFPRPVAVNDLGWVSFQNGSFVLDLWGLGSEKVRRARQGGHFGREEVAALTQEAGVAFAMIYRSWFEDAIPETWCLMAVLHGERVSSASADVHFYATSPAAEGEMRDALDRFAPSLPARVTLQRPGRCSPG